MSSTDEKPVGCEHCGRHYRWQAKVAGKKVRCKCGEAMLMPAHNPADNSIPLEMEDDLLMPPVKAEQSVRKNKSAPTAKPAASSASLLDGPSAVDATGYCPECKAAVKSGAVICISCGFNIKENKKLSTATGGIVRASTGPADGPRRAYTNGQDGFMTRFSRGWEMSKIAYGIIWDFKKLMIFPVFSAIAAILVSLSFIFPWFMLAPESTSSASASGQPDPGMENVINIAMGLAFYFCNFFVIVFFNTALTACAMKITAGESPSIRYGLSIAVKRIPQIAAWALVSAIVGQLIKILESRKIIGKIVAVILGSGWAILTYFVVPVLCVEGVGPIKAIKGSFNTIRESWGESLVGNSGLSVLNFLLSLPAILMVGGGIYLMANEMPGIGIPLACIGVVLFLVFCAAASAADGVFRALLYNYATGREMPADIDMDVFASAFASK